jgi:hypothetical protein
MQSAELDGKDMKKLKKYIIEAKYELEAFDAAEAKRKFVRELVYSRKNIEVCDYKCKECGSEKGLHGWYGPDKKKLCSKAMVY